MRDDPVLLRGLGCGKQRSFAVSFPNVWIVRGQSQEISAYKKKDDIETEYVPYLLTVYIDVEKYRFGGAHVEQ